MAWQFGSKLTLACFLNVFPRKLPFKWYQHISSQIEHLRKQVNMGCSASATESLTH